MSSILPGVTRRGVIAAAGATLLARPALAQAWPAREITFYVPFGPGGSTDPLSRTYCTLMEKLLPVKFVVENKPGGAATIGTGAVIRARPDGYTLGLGSNSSMVFQPLINQSLSWSSPEDFQSIIKLVDIPAILAVRADAPWKNLQEFIDHARANPRRVRAANSGLRTMPDLTTQQLNRKAGTNIVPVPFTGGGGEALLALLGGRVEAVMGYAAGMRGQAEAGRIRILAVFQKGQYPLFPDATPSVDAGYDVTLPAAYYVLGPKGMPPEILGRIMDASRQVVRMPEFIQFAATNGYVIDAREGDAMKAELLEYQQTFRDLLTYLNSRG